MKKRKDASKASATRSSPKKHTLRNALVCLLAVLVIASVGQNRMPAPASTSTGVLEDVDTPTAVATTAETPSVEPSAQSTAASDAAATSEDVPATGSTQTDGSLPTEQTTTTPSANQGNQPTPVGADQAANPAAAEVPSASTVPGADFLAALDAYVAANPTADEGDLVEVDGNVPSFGAQDATTEAFQSFSGLDTLGRCGTAYACLGPETLPTEQRGDISEVHPTGWRHDDYDFVDGGSLYNRSHLIAFSLSGQNANERNLITGTRHMNAEVMEPIEAMVLDYIEQSGNHVLYRVTPVFEGDELVARGVQIEALSMEDGGQGVSINVYLRNVQPGVAIDYATGDNWADETAGGAGTGGSGNAGVASGASVIAATDPDSSAPTAAAAEPSDTPASVSYVVNTNTGKFHRPDCASAAKIKEKNRLDSTATRDKLIAQGYVPCKNCNP